jgi:hypothetical protein
MDARFCSLFPAGKACQLIRNSGPVKHLSVHPFCNPRNNPLKMMAFDTEPVNALKTPL